MAHKWILGIGLVVVTVPFAVVMMGRARAEGAFREQIRLARSEGIPTDGQAYAATIPKASAAENAAPFYRRLPQRGSEGERARKLEMLLLANPEVQEQEVEAFLRQNDTSYKIIDEATQLPRCWFDRDWADGPAVLMPEYAPMKMAARLLGLRGSRAATRGDHAAALQNAERIFRIAAHAGEEGHPLSRVMADTVHVMGLRRLAAWGSLHRERPEYREALAKALREYPKPNPQREHAADLYSLLWLVENIQTPEGRAKIGLRDEDVPKAAKVVPLLMDKDDAKIALVAAERKLWAAYGSESPDPATIKALRHDRLKALIAFPAAADLSEMLMIGDNDETLGKGWAARRILYSALLRTIEGPTVPKTIKTSDLLSPFDGKPLRYRFDGKQLTLSIGPPSASELPTEITVPVQNRKALMFKSL